MKSRPIHTSRALGVTGRRKQRNPTISKPTNHKATRTVGGTCLPCGGSVHQAKQAIVRNRVRTPNRMACAGAILDACGTLSRR